MVRGRGWYSVRDSFGVRWFVDGVALGEHGSYVRRGSLFAYPAAWVRVGYLHEFLEQQTVVDVCDVCGAARSASGCDEELNPWHILV